jgi:hypothetical protein
MDKSEPMARKAKGESTLAVAEEAEAESLSTIK